MRPMRFGENPGQGGRIIAPNASPVAPEVQYVEDFFVYEIDFLNLLAGSTRNGVIQIDADSDFKWVKATQITDNAGVSIDVSTMPIPLATVQILDGSSSRQLSSAPVPIGSIFGTPGLPFILSVPKIFKSRSTI